MADGNGSPVAGTSDDTGGNRSVLQNAVRVLSNIATTLSKSFPQVTSTASTATAGAAALPAAPAGFIVISLPNGTTAKVAFYND